LSWCAATIVVPLPQNKSITDFSQKFDNINHTFDQSTYHNCKMLKDVGSFKKGSTYSQIAIGGQLIGFNNNDEVIFDELVS
jgi:hypothetical protein